MKSSLSLEIKERGEIRRNVRSAFLSNRATFILTSEAILKSNWCKQTKLNRSVKNFISINFSSILLILRVNSFRKTLQTNVAKSSALPRDIKHILSWQGLFPYWRCKRYNTDIKAIEEVKITCQISLESFTAIFALVSSFEFTVAE